MNKAAVAKLTQSSPEETSLHLTGTKSPLQLQHFMAFTGRRIFLIHFAYIHGIS
jgi:hypothetical protein